MIEEKLQNAANLLPDPRSDFPAVEKHSNTKQRTSSRPRKRLVAAMLLAVLLVGCVAASAPDYHLYNGNWWNFLPGVFFDPAEEFGLHDDQTMKTAEKLGITLPETLGGYPVIGFSKLNLTTKKVPIQIAWLSPHYVYYSSYYGVDMEEPRVSPDGIEGTHHWSEGADVTYGPTDNEIWRRQFGYDENNAFVATNWTLADHPVEEISSLEYEGITVYVAKIGIMFREKPMWDVTWVDVENGVVFSIDEYYENPDTLIAYAKEIIDLNK